MNTPIANELIDMAQYDLRVRDMLLKANLLSPGYNPDMERVHESNAARLEVIIDAMGYPTRSNVGPQASDAA
ncbi:hypothetical protein [Pedobacter yulinensis]|nr:hypothetical protein [Pedobacter yulinensis]